MQLLAKTIIFLLIDGLFASPFIGLPEKNSQPADFEDFDACKSSSSEKFQFRWLENSVIEIDIYSFNHLNCNLSQILTVNDLSLRNNSWSRTM